MIKNQNIVCLSTHYWHEPWFRKQHFMSRFAKNNNFILYVEPTFSMFRKPHKDAAKNMFLLSKLERLDENIFIIKLPRALPKWTKPTISKLNYCWFVNIINKIIKKFKIDDYILWIYRPEYYQVLKYFNYSKLVFGLSDDLAAYNESKDKIYYWKYKCIEGLIKKSDLCIFSAKHLLEKYGHIAKDKVFYVPNGYDFKLFNSRNNSICPEELRKFKSPIIGFVGVLFGFLDYNLIDYIADSNENWSIVLIGPIEPFKTKEDIQNLKLRKNIYFLGRKNREEIVNYIKEFDVCINPFKVNEASKSINPLKVYEYLACGKPVVSTRMESLEKEKIGNVIEFANDYEDFVNKIKLSLHSNSSFNEQRRVKIVKEYSWDRLFLKLNDVCKEIKLV